MGGKPDTGHPGPNIVKIVAVGFVMIGAALFYAAIQYIQLSDGRGPPPNG